MNNDLLLKFINTLMIEIKSIPEDVLPIKIDISNYDNIGDNEKELLWKSYNKLFYSIESYELTYICDSTNLGDGPEYGDYDIYIGKITDSIAAIYYADAHEQEVPNRLTVLNDTIMCDMWSCSTEIDIYPTNKKTYDFIMNTKNPLYVKDAITLLKSQDRPELFKLRL